MADKQLNKQNVEEAQAKKLKLIDEIVHHIKDEEIQRPQNVPENKSDSSQTCNCSVHPKIVQYIKEALMNTEKLIPYMQDEHLAELAQLLDEPCTCNQSTKDKVVKELIEFIEHNRDDSINHLADMPGQENELKLMKYSQEFEESVKEVLENVLSIMFLQLSSANADSGAETRKLGDSAASLEVRNFSYHDRCPEHKSQKQIGELEGNINSETKSEIQDSENIDMGCLTIEANEIKNDVNSSQSTLQLGRVSTPSVQQNRNTNNMDEEINASFNLSSEDSDELTPEVGHLNNIGDSSAVNYSHSILCECIPHEGGAAVPVLSASESSQSLELINNHRLDVLSHHFDSVSEDSGYVADCNPRGTNIPQDGENDFREDAIKPCPDKPALIDDKLTSSQQLCNVDPQIEASFLSDTTSQTPEEEVTEEIQTDLVLGPRLLSESLNSCVSHGSGSLDSVKEPRRLEAESEINIMRFISDSVDEIFLQKLPNDNEENDDEDDDNEADNVIDGQTSQRYNVISQWDRNKSSASKKKKVKRCPKQLSVHFNFTDGTPCYSSASDDCNFNEPAQHEPDMKDPGCEKTTNDIINIKPFTECCYPSQIIMVDEVHTAKSQPLKPTRPQIFAVVNLPMDFFRVPKRIHSCVFLTQVELSKLEECYSDAIIERHASSMPLISSRVKITVSAIEMSQAWHKSDNNPDVSKTLASEQEKHSKQNEASQSSTTSESQLQDRVKSAVALCETQLLPMKEQLNSLLRKVRNLKLTLDGNIQERENQNSSSAIDLEIRGNVHATNPKECFCSNESLDCLYFRKITHYKHSELHNFGATKYCKFCNNNYNRHLPGCCRPTQRNLHCYHMDVQDQILRATAQIGCEEGKASDIHIEMNGDPTYMETMLSDANRHCCQTTVLQCLPLEEQFACSTTVNPSKKNLNFMNKYSCSSHRGCVCRRIPRYYRCPYSHPPHFYCRHHSSYFANNCCQYTHGINQFQPWHKDYNDFDYTSTNAQCITTRDTNYYEITHSFGSSKKDDIIDQGVQYSTYENQKK